VPRPASGAVSELETVEEFEIGWVECYYWIAVVVVCSVAGSAKLDDLSGGQLGSHEAEILENGDLGVRALVGGPVVVG
jgi:hypothetical protein